jgi:hypothetical protein
MSWRDRRDSYGGRNQGNSGRSGRGGPSQGYVGVWTGAPSGSKELDERDFFRESQTQKPALLNCPFCRTQETYELRWLVRQKIDRLPQNADERSRAKFAKAASYMVLLDDHQNCRNERCRKRFEISGIKTMAFL